MIDLTSEERATLARLQRSDALVYRQAETFALVIGGYYVCELKSEVCKHLIELSALIEIGSNSKDPQITPDETDWIYAADPSLFGPAFVISQD